MEEHTAQNAAQRHGQSKREKGKQISHFLLNVMGIYGKIDA